MTNSIRWNRAALLLASVGGLAIAYVDSRPNWDDTGITATAMLLLAGIVGFGTSLSPWLVALSVGIWIPIHALLLSPTPATLRMLAVLIFPLFGAYAGAVCRRLLVRANRDTQ